MRPITIRLLRLCAWLEGIRIQHRIPLDSSIPSVTTSWRFQLDDGRVFGDAMGTEVKVYGDPPPSWHETWALLSGLSGKANATEFANVKMVPPPWYLQPRRTKKART